MQAGNDVKVSIGMPVYNGMPYLPASLDSILSQTFADFEVVICDNASTDATQTVCEAYACRDKRIRYFRNPTNIGAAANYNRVFELSKGQYFKWAAADDLLAPEMIGKCAAALDSNAVASLAYPNTIIIDGNGEHRHVILDDMDVSSQKPVERVRAIWSLLGECNAVFGLMRSSVLARTALIGCYIASDGHLLAELAMHGPFERIPDVLFFRRDHAAASSADKSVKSQLHFFDPRLGGRFIMSRWRAYRSDLRAIRRAPLTTLERATLCKGILRGMYWDRAKLGSEILLRTRQMIRLNVTS